MNKNGERCFYSFIYIFICSPHALTNHVFGCMQLQSCSSFCSHVNKTVNTLIPTAMAAKSQIGCKKRMDVGASEREALNLHSFYRPAGGSWSGWKKSDCIEVQSLISGLTECNKQTICTFPHSILESVNKPQLPGCTLHSLYSCSAM